MAARVGAADPPRLLDAMGSAAHIARSTAHEPVAIAAPRREDRSMPLPDTITSEEDLIQRFLAPLSAGAPGALGLTDDCAVIAPGPGHELVLKTDAVAEGVHFLADDTPEDIAWKALAVNVSDLAAKGARPVGYLLSLSFPMAPARTWMTRFAAGLAEAQAAFTMHLLGGDTDRRPGPISITPMAIGEVPAGRMLRRGAARAGDVLFVSGTLGDAALGLRLRRESRLAAELGLSQPEVRHLARRYVRPEPRLGLREALLGHARAAMDLSDGLAKDLGRMCRASGVGAKVEVAALPVSGAARAALARDPALVTALVSGGDDYEVLAAVPSDGTGAFEAAARAGGVAVARIGACAAGSDVVIAGPDGTPLRLARPGWDHF
jgi:thiamine-monophosphate kinase